VTAPQLLAHCDVLQEAWLVNQVVFAGLLLICEAGARLSSDPAAM
jgi:hypothetical protein